MRVALDAHYGRTTAKEILPEGGIGRCMYELARNLLAHGTELELVLFVPPAHIHNAVKRFTVNEDRWTGGCPTDCIGEGYALTESKTAPRGALLP